MDDASIGAVLDRLRPHLDVPLIAQAARTIRRLAECVSLAEWERDEAELRAWAYLAEIDRMTDHRRAWEERRRQKAAAR